MLIAGGEKERTGHIGCSGYKKGGISSCGVEREIGLV